MVLEKTLGEDSLDCKEIKLVNPKGNQSWIFIVKIGAEAESPKLWPPDAKNWLIGKDPNSGKDWRQEDDNPLQYSCMENPMDRGAWWATVHGFAKSQTRLSDTCTDHEFSTWFLGPGNEWASLVSTSVIFMNCTKESNIYKCLKWEQILPCLFILLI